MTEPAVSVSPYWELTFDADGDVDGRERDRLLDQVPRRGVRDLIVFAHGWNNDRSAATRLFSQFFEPVPGLAPTARLGYVGVVWPSMRFSDEPVPGFPPSVAADVTDDSASPLGQTDYGSTISEVKDDDIVLSEDVMSELKNIGKAAKIIVHGVSLSIGSHDGWSTSYLRLLDSFLDQIDVHIPASICYLHRNPWFAEQPAFAGRMSAIGV